jgi:hypothetical protein
MLMNRLSSGWNAACSFGLSATSQQYFYLRTNHPPAVLLSQNKPVTSNQTTVLFSHNKSAPAISHLPNEQAGVEKPASTRTTPPPMTRAARGRSAMAAVEESRAEVLVHRVAKGRARAADE